jgi:EH domain-containing protein 3/EH domain-containing protein 1
LNSDLPGLISKIPSGNPTLAAKDRNPFASDELDSPIPTSTPTPPSPWEISTNDKARYHDIFGRQLTTLGGGDRISGADAKSILMESGLSNETLAHIWRLSDLTSDGYLDADEFAIAMHLTKIVQDGVALPEKLPPSLLA